MTIRVRRNHLGGERKAEGNSSLWNATKIDLDSAAIPVKSLKNFSCLVVFLVQTVCVSQMFFFPSLCRWYSGSWPSAWCCFSPVLPVCFLLLPSWYAACSGLYASHICIFFLYAAGLLTFFLPVSFLRLPLYVASMILVPLCMSGYASCWYLYASGMFLVSVCMIPVCFSFLFVCCYVFQIPELKFITVFRSV